MSKYCYVCKTKDQRTFHRFPSDKRKLQMWCDILKLDPSRLKKYSYICSAHFSTTQIVIKPQGKTCLRTDAIPNVQAVDRQLGSLSTKSKPKVQTVGFVLENCQGPEGYLHERIPISSHPGGVSIKSEPEFQTVEFVPETSYEDPNEYLPEHTPISSQTKGVGTPKRHFPGRVYCRLCLEPAARDQMVPLTLMDINFTDKSKAYKQAETMQTHRITNIIRVVMPEFDFDSVYNPMVCDKCIARLESVYSFIKECQENENIIQLYKSNFSPNEKLVSCEDVAQNKSLLMKQYPPRKRQKTPKQQNSSGSISGSGPEQSESGLFDDSQYERHEIVNTGSGDSQENFATETGMGLCSSIKCEMEDYEDYSSYTVKSEEISCIVKEESVSEVISCDIADTPTNERICQPDMDYPVKIEDCSQSDALGMSEIEDYHNIPSEYSSSNQKSQTFSRTKT